ncbi:MAG: DNA polymerase III subunit delta [Candidatus Staskawiczbacteria bacterium CG10_big_fil_rev_8_21_14_0_10_38_10]|uniref:DNA polymerase III subunit delta n=1 Tax=Candidatus Staskawiczbacteria bacterium CG10_big_fil_rev_8_21_14_0_10_38_10 TaxID=1974891 RepID=A0A2H9T1R1_9BACT|nr:MAG: DNA polymerase III subunit delta [Candidatus Staskawiczbacteria bacterium CG10_big_fil_rev_8_21_14_0_10_38_10]
MIIFLYGPDSYRAREKLNEIIKGYKKIHKSGLNFKYFDAEEINFQDFSDTFKITSMFAETKLIILKNVFSRPKFQEDFLKEVKNLINSKDIILIYEDGEINAKNKLFNFLKKETKSQEFKLLVGQALRNWTRKEFEKYRAKIDQKAEELLVEYTGNDLWKMNNEIVKLANYKREGTIKEEDVKLLVRPEIETDIFKTIDSIAQKNKNKALRLIKTHIEDGDSPLYLLSMINFQFRNLLVVKELIESHKPYNVILKKANLHPFVVKKSYAQAQKFTLEELKKIYRKIFQADLDIKTGRIKPELALDILIAEI